jgi:uncharacterized protein YndB with AHSA1/START domain
MTPAHPFQPDPQLDLSFERIVDVPPERIWAAWTTPALINQWFTPAPWKTSGCQIDLRPGGGFHTVMTSPEGESFPNVGCYLEVVPNRKLVWTSTMGPNYRPTTQPPDALMITAIIQARGTRRRPSTRMKPAGSSMRPWGLPKDGERRWISCLRWSGWVDGCGALRLNVGRDQ